MTHAYGWTTLCMIILPELTVGSFSSIPTIPVGETRGILNLPSVEGDSGAPIFCQERFIGINSAKMPEDRDTNSENTDENNSAFSYSEDININPEKITKHTQTSPTRTINFKQIYINCATICQYFDSCILSASP